MNERDYDLRNKRKFIMKYIPHKIGNLTVEQRQSDGYINATKLTKAYEAQAGIKKNANQWFETDRANRYIELLSDKTGLSVSQLFQTKTGGQDSGTWIHPKLAISFSMWLSPEFEMMVSEWVEEWMMTGKNPVQQTIPLHPYQRVWYERLKLFEQNTKLPDGTWCVFEEIASLMRNLEAHQLILRDHATIDISVGKTWCNWLKEHKEYDTNVVYKYRHYYPDSRGQQEANIYPFDLLGTFRKWMQDTYIVDKFPDYVRKSCTPEECELISAAIGHEIKPRQRRLKASQTKMGNS